VEREGNKAEANLMAIKTVLGAAFVDYRVTHPSVNTYAIYILSHAVHI
jgi:hypothetical protein